MEQLVLLSVCEKILTKKGKLVGSFHFRGLYRGKELKGVIVECLADGFLEGEEYLLWVEVVKLENSWLYTREIKSKRLDFISWD